MKDAKFIELLNLYLDHEISAADAVRLEAEVKASPARDRTYQEYCRMQKACKALAHEFQSEVAPATGGKVIAFEPAATSTRRTGIYAIGWLGAAAACVAIILVGRNSDSPSVNAGSASRGFVQATPSSLRLATPAASAKVVQDTEAARPMGHLASVPPRRDQPQPMLVGNPLLLTGKTKADALLASAVTQANTQFEWMQTVRFSPIPQRVPLEELRFKPQSTSLQSGSRTYGDPQSLEGGVESVGFSITK